MMEYRDQRWVSKRRTSSSILFPGTGDCVPAFPCFKRFIPHQPTLDEPGRAPSIVLGTLALMVPLFVARM